MIRRRTRKKIHFKLKREEAKHQAYLGRGQRSDNKLPLQLNPTKGNAKITEIVSPRVKEKGRKVEGEEIEGKIELTVLDRAGPSKPLSGEESTSKLDRSKAKTTKDKAVQMRQSFATSTEKLYATEDFYNDSSTEEPPRAARYVLVGWDSSRSKIMLLLMILFLLWACIYFPLIAS